MNIWAIVKTVPKTVTLESCVEQSFPISKDKSEIIRYRSRNLSRSCSKMVYRSVQFCTQKYSSKLSQEQHLYSAYFATPYHERFLLKIFRKNVQNSIHYTTLSITVFSWIKKTSEVIDKNELTKWRMVPWGLFLRILHILVIGPDIGDTNLHKQNCCR